MAKVIRKLGADCGGGIYFNKQDGSLGATTVSQVLLRDVKPGDCIIANGTTTVSCLADMSVPYYGFNDNCFTASGLFLSRRAQGMWFSFDYTIELSRNHGQDIHPGQVGDRMSPYYNHDETGMHQFEEGQAGDWLVVFAAWCSSSSATGDSVAKNQYLRIIDQQTLLQVTHLPG